MKSEEKRSCKISIVVVLKAQGGYSGINVTGGIVFGLKFSTPVFFWVEDLTMYFFGSKKSARIFLGLNFRWAN